MKTPIVSITLAELQEALNDYCAKHAASQVECVHVMSHERTRILVELRPKGLVSCEEAFKHRSEA